MGITSSRHAGGTSRSGLKSLNISKGAWTTATLGIASMMLMQDSADAQPVSAADDLPQVRVTAPKQQAKRQAARRAPARPVAATPSAAPSDAVVNPVIGDGAGIAGYTTPAQAGISRFPTPLLSTPQTVNVVSQQLMQDQRTTSVQEALRNVPGITFTAGEGGIQGDNINIRGYSARNDFYRDGIRDPGYYARDAFSFDRVEVYKGPSSFVFGRGSTGGVVNVVSKLPNQTRDFYVVDGQFSSAGGGRVTTDFNKTFGDVTARLSMLGYDANVPGRDFANIKRYGFAPSVTWQINDQVKNTVSYTYQNDDNVADRGIPLIPGSYFGTAYRQPAPVPRNTYYGSMMPGLEDVEQTQAHNFLNKFEYDITPAIKFTNSTGYTLVDRFNRTRAVQLTGLGTATSNLWDSAVGGTRLATPGNPLTATRSLNNVWVDNANWYQNSTSNRLLSNVSDMTAKFNTFGLQHTVLMGMEFSREDRENYRDTFVNANRVNLGSPSPYSPGTLSSTTAATISSANTQGFYVQDQLKVTEWLELLGGLRFDNFDASASTYTTTRATGAVAASPAPLNLDSKNSFLTYRAGVVLHPTANSSVYYMRGTSANPVAEFTTISATAEQLKPSESEIDEIGAKADLLDNKLNVSAAVFRIKKKNDFENRGTNAAPDFVAIGTSQVEGFEIGATGKLTDAWSISTGYAYLKSRLIDSVTTANIGNELAMTPTNSFSLFTTYQIDNKWTVGAGAYYVGSRWTAVANDARIPDYWRFDAMAAYRVNRNFTLQLNVYNLANEYYFDSAAGAGFAVPGAGRYVSLSGRASF